MSDPQHIVILGGDMAGPMAAAYVARHLPAHRFQITFIDTGALDHAGLCMSAAPSLRRFNRALKLPERDFILGTHASFKLGDLYKGLGARPYINAFGHYGLDIEGIGFHHHLLRLLGPEGLCDYGAYSLPVQAANARRFSPPDSQGNVILSDYDYGYHMNPHAYARILTRTAIEFGVKHRESNTVKISQTDGNIDSVITQDGETHKADLYIVTGANTQLQSQNLKGGFEDWSAYGFGQSVSYSHITPPQSPLSLTTKIETLTQGWAIHGSTQSECYSAQFYNAPRTGEYSFKPGRAAAPWSGNFLRMGHASANIVPILGLTLRAMQLDIERFIKLCPPDLNQSIESHEYNRQSALSYDHIRDYLALHFATQNKDQNALSLPQTAQHLFDMFKTCGQISLHDQADLFQDQWIPMLLGHGVRPERYDSLAHTLPLQTLRENIAQISHIICDRVNAMPVHEAFILKNCATKGFRYESE